MKTPPPIRAAPTGTTETAVLGAGCFWCTEAVFQRLPGVISASPGYAGGSTRNPTYKDVSTGKTGHAEVARIEFDPARISYEKLLDAFWHMHDPTTPNRQGADVGTQYRSVVFYANEAQKSVAEESRRKLEQSGTFPAPIVTQIEPLTNFHPAEDYHKEYFKRNASAPYCRLVIEPKLKKLGLSK